MAKKAAASKSSGGGIVINKQLFKSKKFILSALAVALVVSLYTKIIQVHAVDNGFQVTYHSDRKDLTLDALGEIKAATSAQVEKAGS